MSGEIPAHASSLFFNSIARLFCQGTFQQIALDSFVRILLAANDYSIVAGVITAPGDVEADPLPGYGAGQPLDSSSASIISVDARFVRALILVSGEELQFCHSRAVRHARAVVAAKPRRFSLKSTGTRRAYDLDESAKRQSCRKTCQD